MTYNRYSYVYDVIGGQFERPYALRGLDLLKVQNGECVLEVGFGTGHIIQALAQRVGRTGKVFGIDISERMCAITRRRIASSKVSNRVKIHCGDAMKLPFENAQFDALFMSFTLELFDTPEIPIILKDCKRVLKPQGRIVNVSLQKQQSYPPIERIYEWIHRLFPQWVDCRPIQGSKAFAQAGFLVKKTLVQPMFGLLVSIILVLAP